MFKISLVGILTGALALGLWLAISTALDLTGIWQKNGVDPEQILYAGAWFAGIGGFLAPVLLFVVFRAIYAPRQKKPRTQ